ncbi:unnamed protein product [Diamesa hyperborea]
MKQVAVGLFLFAVIVLNVSGLKIKNSENELYSIFSNSTFLFDGMDKELLDNINAVMKETESVRRWPKQLTDQVKEALLQRQIPPITGDPVTAVAQRVPCQCKNGVCSCCMGGFFFNNKGCMNLKYVPEDFSFELRMTFNDNVLYKNQVSGKNPRPICISVPPRLNVIDMCARFHDVYFVGRNIHVCLDMDASFNDFELFNREFSCMRFGANGVAIVNSEDGGGFPSVNGGTDAEIDAGGPDEIGEYDEVLG